MAALTVVCYRQASGSYDSTYMYCSTLAASRRAHLALKTAWLGRRSRSNEGTAEQKFFVPLPALLAVIFWQLLLVLVSELERNGMDRNEM
ncbi:uncharacterized protein K452DRAFT_290954, partial [Aplosporella prunicola CBS 121167]